MDNCSNYHPDEIKPIFCKKCGHPIEDPVEVKGEEINLCEECLRKESQMEVSN